MSMLSSIKLGVTLIMVVGKALALALYGAYRTMRALIGLPGRIAQVRRLMGDSLDCPWCGEPNATVARWNCATCHGQYLGFVGRCALCQAGAQYFPCARCGGSIVLGDAT